MIRGPGLKPKQTSQVSVRSNLLQLISAYLVSSLVLVVRLICFATLGSLSHGDGDGDGDGDGNDNGKK